MAHEPYRSISYAAGLDAEGRQRVRAAGYSGEGPLQPDDRRSACCSSGVREA